MLLTMIRDTLWIRGRLPLSNQAAGIQCRTAHAWAEISLGSILNMQLVTVLSIESGSSKQCQPKRDELPGVARSAIGRWCPVKQVGSV